jgi:uncharacterized repeat protein (TIGR03943 family)
MKSPEEYLKRWLHPAVFAIWTVFLLYLLVSQRYVAYLRPEFGLLLAVAHFVAMGFMLAAMIRPIAKQISLPAILRALVLLVPVVFSMAVPDKMLGNQAFKKRFVGTNNGAISRQTPSWLSSKKPDPIQLPEEIEDVQQKTLQVRTIKEIYLNPNLYNGQRVVVTGMILHDEQLKPHFGGRDTAVYRFLITCCVADALPLAIALNTDQADAIENDQWVEVDGIFDFQQVNGKPVPMISNPRIKPVEAPKVPYLF